MNDLESCIVDIYVVVATLGAFFLAYVLRQAINDNTLSRTDPRAIKKFRKGAFGTAAYFLLLTVFFRDRWLLHPSLVATGLVAIGFMMSAIFILTVNSVSLKRRTPDDGTGIRLPNAAPVRLRGPRYP